MKSVYFYELAESELVRHTLKIALDVLQETNTLLSLRAVSSASLAPPCPEAPFILLACGSLNVVRLNVCLSPNLRNVCSFFFLLSLLLGFQLHTD